MPIKMSQVEASIRVVLRFYEAFNRHEAAAMAALTGEDCHFESSAPAPDGAAHDGRAALTQYWQTYFSEHPQAHVDVEDIFGLGLRCVARWRVTWQDTAGQAQTMRGAAVFRVQEDLIQEHYAYIKGPL
jgi:predicted SnoaL-like aldol condensation-catalyzing enzyme